jgi:hypothetical protein
MVTSGDASSWALTAPASSPCCANELAENGSQARFLSDWSEFSPPDVAKHQEQEYSSPCEEEYYSFLDEKLNRCPYSLDELTYHLTQGLFY